jgi:hypothetical protein
MTESTSTTDPAQVSEDRLDELCAIVEADPTTEIRVEAIEELLAVAKAGPKRFTTDRLHTLANGLDEPSRTGETRLSYVFYRVGRADPSLVKPVVDDLQTALDRYAPVRSKHGPVTNLAFPIGAVAAEWPNAVRPPQSSLSLVLQGLAGVATATAAHARHSLAWAIERRALAYPRATAVRFDWIDDLLTAETHPPVLKHVARLVAHLERHQPGFATGMAAPLARATETDSERTTVAGCMALGALGSEPAIDRLETLARGADSERVRTAARRALREGTCPDDATPATEQLLSATSLDGIAAPVDEGDWLWVEPRAFPVRTGTVRGRIESIEAIGGGIELTLHNPYEGYEVALVDTGDTRRPTAEYADDRQSGTMAFQCERFGVVTDDLLPLLYALPADRLSFTVEGRPSQVVVTDVDHGPERRRVHCRDRQRGEDIEFRLCTRTPTLALFAGGRSFEAAEFALDPQETVDTDDQDIAS